MIRILRYPEVQDVVGGVSRKTLERWIKAGHFPQPVKLGIGSRASVGFRSDQLERWIKARPVDDLDG